MAHLGSKLAFYTEEASGKKSGCFHRGNLLIFLFAFSLLFCQWRTFRCIFDAKQMIIYALAKKSDAWSASLGIFDSMAAYGLASYMPPPAAIHFTLLLID